MKKRDEARRSGFGIMARQLELGLNDNATLMTSGYYRDCVANGLKQSADGKKDWVGNGSGIQWTCLLYTSPSPRDRQKSRMPSSA